MTDMAADRTSPRFWDRAARKYARSKIADEAAYQRKLGLTQRLMTKDMSALELGCGTGSTALLHAPYVGTYLATDFSPKMIDIAREKAWEASLPNLRFDVAAGEDVLKGTARYDMVLALSLLHLVPGWRDVMRQVYDSLEPGGYFVTSTACLGDMAWYIRAILRPGHRLGLFPPVEVFNGEDLRAEMRRTGFDLVEDWRPKPSAALFLIGQKPA